MLRKRVISLFLVLLLLFSAAAICAYADEEDGAVDEEVEEFEDEEETEEPTEAPTEAPTEPPKPAVAKLGYAAYVKKLEETLYRDDDLGATYTKNYTKFKVWSPAADDVKVCIYKTGSDDEEGFNTITVKPMKYSKSVGTWYITLDGDYKNLYYTYMVTVGDNTYEVVDPYAKAVGVNGNRGMIVDLDDTDPEGWADDSFQRVSDPADAIVWEINVRDFSASDTSGVSPENRGKYLAFTESNTFLNGTETDIPTCVAYLRELGVNYVQINPFYDFASLDESEPLDDQYNWGYDPKNYNAPDGSYSSDPYDGRVRITECKQMIQALHEAGIGVIMDVVYNHTYESENSFFNQLVPSYYYRFDSDGSWSNGSGCGNDVASEHYMASKFIRESVSYWAQEYHIDGFRFDLMGLIDVDTMNGIRSDLDALPDGDKIIMYGEAWNMKTATASSVILANQNNMDKLSSRIGAFNDTGRDAIKGSTNGNDKGFIQSGSGRSSIHNTIEGTAGGWASIPSQCVNYASCHDNLTLYDKLTDSVYDDDEYDLHRDDLAMMNRISATIVLMSRGMPFMLAGEELGRTKQGDENSYKSSVKINQIDWTSRYRFATLTDYYKGLISIRKAVPALRGAVGTDAEIEYLNTSEKSTLAFAVTGADSPSVVVAMNAAVYGTAEVSLPAGKWIILADRDFAGLESLGSATDTLKVPAQSSFVLVDADNYEKIGVETSECVVYLRYRDNKNDGAIVCEERLTGAKGESYVADTPIDVLFRYDIVSQDPLSGEFTKKLSIVDVVCEKYEGDFSTVTFRYLNYDERPLTNSIVLTNRVGQQYFTPSLPGFTDYLLDLDNLPENGAGLFTEEPIEVIYHYKPNEEEIPEGEEPVCRANVIYMADDGTILEKKTYTGAVGDELKIEELEFEGLNYYDTFSGDLVFSENELNVIVGYEKPKNTFLKNLVAFIKSHLTAVIICVLAVGMAIFGAVFYGRTMNKKKKMASIDIEE